MDDKHYNTTDLDPETTFERHVFHRDQFAHYLRWSFVLNRIGRHESVVDFGCGKGLLAEVLYRNRHTPLHYYGFDVRGKTIEKAAEKFKDQPWARFFTADLVKIPQQRFEEMSLNAQHICSFEVVEHIGKQNIQAYLANMAACGNTDSFFYLSTPNHDPRVGAADNHTYDSGDGRGIAVQEFTHNELEEELKVRFDVLEKFGTFASIRDYKPFMNDHQEFVFNELKKYYNTDIIAVMMAPMFPERSRNTLWVMRKKQ